MVGRQLQGPASMSASVGLCVRRPLGRCAPLTRWCILRNLLCAGSQDGSQGVLACVVATPSPALRSIVPLAFSFSSGSSVTHRGLPMPPPHHVLTVLKYVFSTSLNFVFMNTNVLNYLLECLQGLMLTTLKPKLSPHCPYWVRGRVPLLPQDMYVTGTDRSSVLQL